MDMKETILVFKEYLIDLEQVTYDYIERLISLNKHIVTNISDNFTQSKLVMKKTPVL